MDKSLNEEIFRINNLIGVITEQNTDRGIFNKLNSLRYWLYRSNGLNLQKLIDDFLDQVKSTIGNNEIDDNITGAQYLLDSGKISKSTFDNFVRDLPNMKLVYSDSEGKISSEGKWHPVNKLNTNYSDLAELLTSTLIKAKNKGSLAATQILEVISSTNDENKIKEILLKYKSNLHILFEKYLEGPNELMNYTKNIKINSEFGEKMEENVLNAFKKIGYKELYRGGDGNFVDMKFSVDLIMKTPAGGIKSIQVKSSKNQVERFLKDYLNLGRHKAVDFLVYPEGDKFSIYDLNKKIKVSIPK
jgi:hypothetical protein